MEDKKELRGLIQQFHDPDIQVISFDIFDTLLLRPFGEKEKFVLLNKKFRQISNCNISFEKLRTMSEECLRRKIIQGTLSKEDITIDEIYDVMHRDYFIEKEITSVMKEEEYQLELRFCTPRKTGAYLYEQALLSGKRVVLITDMYLRKEQIQKLLEQNGYGQAFELYVSSEIGLRKNTGNLYRYVLRENRITASQMLHIGDNRESDVKIPCNLGIRSIYFPSTVSMYEKYGCGNQVKKMCKDLTNWEIGSREHGIAIMKHMAANYYFDNPYRYFNQESDYNNDPDFVGYGALGMEILALVRWLIDNVKRDHIKKMIFLSRDGYLPMQAYQMFLEKNPDLPKAYYLHTSRLALLPVMIKEKEDLFDLPIDISYHNPEKLLKILAFCEKENAFEGMITQNPGHSYEKGKAFVKESYWEFISDFIKYGYDSEKHNHSKAAVRRYLLQRVEDDTAIFDMGYSGRLAGAIKEAVHKDFSVYYFHTDGLRVYEEEEKYHIRIRSFFDFSPYMESTLREYAYLEPAPSCIGYQPDGTLMWDGGQDDAYKKVVTEFQKGALSFVKDFLDGFASYEKETAFRYHNGAMFFESFIRHCSGEDRKMFASVLMDDELWGGRRDINLLKLMERRLLKMPEYATEYEEATDVCDQTEQDFPMNPDDMILESALNWYEFRKDSRVLLLDCGVDAYVNLLSRRCRKVTVLVKSTSRLMDLQKKYKEKSNIQPVLSLGDKLYDYVIGTDCLECEKYPEEELRMLLSLLKPKGRLLLLCDNRYGLQYFCGRGEKYTGIPYAGINGYYRDTPVEGMMPAADGHMFSKNRLKQIIKAAGDVPCKFYYPVPDAGMPQMIFTDHWNNSVNVMERMVDYHYSHRELQGIEHRIMKDVIEEGALPFLSNSFFIELSPDGSFMDMEYGVVTTDRGKEYGMVTSVREDGSVYKRPLWDAGEKQLRFLVNGIKELEQAGVSILHGSLMEDESGCYMKLPYVEGENLSVTLNRLVSSDKDRFYEIMDEIYQAVQRSYRPGKDGKGRVFLDLAPCNCFYLPDNPHGKQLLFYDQEFVDDNSTPEFAMYRTIRYYLESSKAAQKEFPKDILYQRYGITPALIQEFEKKEQNFLKQIRNKDQYQWMFRAATPDYRRIYQNNKGSMKKQKKPYHIGYVPGVFDLFHTGHLKLIKRCKERCDYLIVGVLTDELVEYYKGKKPVISYENRAYVINGLEDVDEVIPVDFSNTDKLDAWEQLHYDCHFSGDDHANHWNDIWNELKKRGSNMEFFSYTEGISSTQIKTQMRENKKE